MSVTESDVLAALKRVSDPDRGQDIVSLGMVSGRAGARGPRRLRHRGRARARPAARTTAQDGGKGGRGAGRRALGLGGIDRGSAAGAACEPCRRPRSWSRPAGTAAQASRWCRASRAIIAVASGKGGVGKSTTAVNLALALAAIGRTVGVLDADIYGPSMPRMLGISGKPRMADAKRLEPMSNYGIKCMSIGFLVAEDTPMIWRGPMVMSALQQMLRDVDWGTLDVMVVDMPPGTGDAQLTMAQQVPLAGAVIVSTPQDIALLDARKGLNMFRKVDVPVLGIVENMSYFLCPHCGERSEIFSHGGARREAERLGVEFLGELPLDMAIRETSDSGRPIVVSDPDSPHAKVYRAIAERIWEKLAGGARPVPRIVVQ